ncbi:SubName: Full=Uncharacterized protein {ECO:0000313/EMBL:CCA72102.1} [Serendipita indica DSM 11827]|nr:SubName: Full=Uncharacterized protein {ECO:0000313/EMBL:CCA72102.1} [Serendipita indica DSM 11827]
MAHNTESSIIAHEQPMRAKLTPTRDDTRGSKRKMRSTKPKVDGAQNAEAAKSGSELQVHSTSTGVSGIQKTSQPETQKPVHIAKTAQSTAQGATRMLHLLSLPVEILAMILEEYHMMDLPLSILMLVCRAMNKHVKNTPRLWRRILLSCDTTTPSDLQTGSTIVCTTQSRFETCVKRARTSPLEATFVVESVEESSPTLEFMVDTFQILMSHSQHISLLRIIINPDTPLQVIKESFHGLFDDSTSFPALESLMIASAFPVPGLLDVFHPLLDQLERTTVKLRSVYFENYKFWRKLRRVTIKGEYSPIHVTAFEGCDDLEFLSISSELLVHSSSALAPPLRHGPLGIRDSNETDFDPTDECKSEYLPVHPKRKVPLTQVQWLRVGAIAMSGLQELQISNVKFLVIRSALPDSAHQAPVPAHSIPLPNLEVFHVGASHSDIIAISAPHMHTLHLEISDLKRAEADRVVSRIFHGKEGMWVPKTLSIDGYIHDKQYAPLYRKLPQIETLTIILGEKPHNTFYKALEKRGMLPNLRHLTIDFDTPLFTTRPGWYVDDFPWMSNGPQTRIIRYPLASDTTSPEPAQATDTMSNWMTIGTNPLESEEDGRGGRRRKFPSMSEQVGPLLHTTALVRANQGLPFASLRCLYRGEYLEVIYVEKNICKNCRKIMDANNPSKPSKALPGRDYGQDQRCGCEHRKTGLGQWEM